MPPWPPLVDTASMLMIYARLCSIYIRTLDIETNYVLDWTLFDAAVRTIGARVSFFLHDVNGVEGVTGNSITTSTWRTRVRAYGTREPDVPEKGGLPTE